MAVNIVHRSDWGALNPRQITPQTSPAKKVIIHHTATRTCKSPQEAIDDLRAIQRTHMNERKFDDIGYNFLVSQDGTVFEGRGWKVVGAHAVDHNKDSLGIAFMGNFNDDTPSTEALLSVKQLIKAGVSSGAVHSEFALLGHRELGQTECPGTKLMAALPQLKAAE